MKLSEQIKRNAIALISLFVAFSALGYNTWRNEASEENRNIRKAGFETIVHIGKLQRTAYLVHFDKDKVRGNPRIGWTEVLLIDDFSRLMPIKVNNKSKSLLKAWENNWQALGTKDEKAIQEIDKAINDLRNVVLQTITELD